MGEVLLDQSMYLDVEISDAFESFGRMTDAGWVMSASAKVVRVGAAMEFAIPFPADPGRGLIRGTGRIAALHPWRRIVIEHESPWTGRTTLAFTRRGRGTQVRAVSELSDDAVEWMKRRIGEPEFRLADNRIVVGLLTSLSGESGLFGRPTVNCAQMAVEEINADGGVLGRSVRLVHHDEATDPVVARTALDYLLTTPELAVVVGSHTSKTLHTMTPRILADRVLYLFAPVNEGGTRSGNLFRLGEGARTQMHFAIPRMMQESGVGNWYLLGNDYSWPREISRVARAQIADSGGRVVRERFLPFGQRNFDDVIDDVASSNADAVVSSLIGFDSIDFERAFHASGLRRRIVTLAPLLEDTTLDHLGSSADGIWSPMSYFGGDASNSAFVNRYHSRWGHNSAPPSSISVSVYDSVHLWARAATTARSIAPDSVADALPGMSFVGARGRVTVAQDGTLTSDMYLARVRRGSFQIEDNLGFRSIGDR